jgi:hypothetical protein
MCTCTLSLTVLFRLAQTQYPTYFAMLQYLACITFPKILLKRKMNNKNKITYIPMYRPGIANKYLSKCISFMATMQCTVFHTNFNFDLYCQKVAQCILFLVGCWVHHELRTSCSFSDMRNKCSSHNVA